MALSGAGLLILEATGVEPQGRITAADLGLWSDDTERALGRVLDAVRVYSAMPLGIQLAHAGRKGSSAVPWAGGQQVLPDQPGGWQTQSASALPHSPTEAPPHAMDAADLRRVRQAFAQAAQRAQRVGLQAIEIHAAHGYLMHQFLSPLSNQRTDAYGGTLANRLRYPLEVFDAVRAAVPASVAVGLRISATDWVEGSWDLAQSSEMAQALRTRGCDFIHVSSGGVSPQQKIRLEAGYQVPFAQAIKQATGLPTMAVGLITEPEQAEQIVQQGQADMVAVARAMLYNPHWPWQAAAKLGAQVQAPPQYWRSAPRGHGDLFAGAKVGQR